MKKNENGGFGDKGDRVCGSKKFETPARPPPPTRKKTMFHLISFHRKEKKGVFLGGGGTELGPRLLAGGWRGGEVGRKGNRRRVSPPSLLLPPAFTREQVGCGTVDGLGAHVYMRLAAAALPFCQPAVAKNEKRTGAKMKKTNQHRLPRRAEPRMG